MPKKPLPEAERFWRHVDIRGPDECWAWLAYRLPTGYGLFDFRGKRTTALRVAMILSGIDVPAALNALHSCDNPPCCNPSHGFVGTQKDNLDDMREKGRAGDCRNFGEKHGRCVISDEKLAELRRRYAAGGISQDRLAAEYGLSQTHVSRLVRRENRAIPTAEAEARRLP